MPETSQVTRDWIENCVQAFIAESPLNTMDDGTGEPAWDEALIGFSSGMDPIWQQYKEFVGPFHWTPLEVFSQHCPEHPAGPGDLTVISWVLPQRKPVRQSNRMEQQHPSERWARIRVFGEEFNAGLRRHLVRVLFEKGHPAVAPMLTPNWTFVKSQRFSYASTWSERHAAYAAGLGTFGLCDGLITRKGKAMRVGSIVAKISLEATPRPYNDHHAFCLYYTHGVCGKCMDRCPAGAITREGHDKEKCRLYLAKTREYVKATYAFEGYGCGLCQVKVPCESFIPVKAARKAVESGTLPPPPPPLA